MGKGEKKHEEDNGRRKKAFKAVVGMVLEDEPMSENIKSVFKLLCHEPVEQLMYDEII